MCEYECAFVSVNAEFCFDSVSQGCYKYGLGDKALNEYGFKYEAKSKDPFGECSTHCVSNFGARAAYVGIYYGKTCVCLERLPEGGVSPNDMWSKCDYKCEGNNSLTCGGLLSAVSVSQIKKSQSVGPLWLVAWGC